MKPGFLRCLRPGTSSTGLKLARGEVATTWLAIGAGVLVSMMTFQAMASEPEWSPSRVKDCDRECLVGFMDGYMNAIYKHDPKAVPPLSVDVRMTENTGHMGLGEGVLWRSKVEPTAFTI
jgi:hypothetical protein